MTDSRPLTRLERRSAAARKGAASRRKMAEANGYVPKCSRCRGPRDTRARYCRKCHAAYQRERRATPHETSAPGASA